MTNLGSEDTMNSVRSQILRKIKAKPRGWAFSAVDFLVLGSRNAVGQSLTRLRSKGEIRRVSQGIYERPKTHPVLGVLPPNVSKVAAAVARQGGVELQASGAAAANALGLSTQVPAKPVYLTSGTSKQIQVGNQIISFQHVNPKRFVMPGTTAGNAFQSILYLGQEANTPELVTILASQLTESEKTKLKNSLGKAPAWAHPTIREICESNEQPLVSAA
jgi:hypothetical protein